VFYNDYKKDVPKKQRERMRKMCKEEREREKEYETKKVGENYTQNEAVHETKLKGERKEGESTSEKRQR
jgi:hypothetical protein